MKFLRLLLLFALVSCISMTSWGQVSFVTDFTGGLPSGWSDTHSETSTQSCDGTSIRDNVYSGSATGNLTTSTGTSNGTDVTFTFDYKVVDWSAATAATAPGWGTLELQYDVNGGGWTTFHTINDGNHVTANTCATVSETLAAANVPNGATVQFRILNTWAAGDYYMYFDDVSITQVATNPPNCTTLSSPSDASTNINVTTDLTWTAATGVPTGYKIDLGTTTGGTDILNDYDAGLVTTYDLPSDLIYNTTYYATVKPYNGNGSATGCTETTFTTKDGCITPFTPSNGSSTADINQTISWSSYTGATGYIVSIGTTAGGTDILNAHDNGTATSYAASGLSYSTQYYVSIKAQNANGLTTAACNTYEFTTQADPTLTPPFTQDFTSYLPTNWTEAKGQLAAPTTFSSTTSSNWGGGNFGNTGTNNGAKMNIYSTGRYEWLITPPIDLGSGSTPYQLEFDLALTPYSGTSSTALGTDDKFIVVISTDNGVTWTSANVLQQWVNGDAISNTGDHIVISLASYSGVVKLGFYAESTVSNTDIYVHVDNVEVAEVPSCSAPSALSATNITSSQADLGWTENGTATTWDIELGTTGFTATGTPTQSGVTANPYTYTGLSANTTYDYYVRADCGGGDYSDWAGPYSFTTLPPAHSFPLTEDFESGFTYFDNASGNDVDFAISTSYYHGGSQSIHNAHGSNNANVVHETGILDLSGTSAAVLEFWHIAKTEGTYDKCYVEISTDGGSTYTAIPNSAYQGSAGDYSSKVYFHEDSYGTWGTSSTTPDNVTWWQKETFSLASYNVSNVRFRFRLTSDGSGNRAGWYIDDIAIYEPTCPAPSAMNSSNVTDDAADLSWTAGNSETAWNLEWKAGADFTPGNSEEDGSASPTTNPTHSLSSLTATTTYYVYYQADCGGSSTSDWVGPYTFTTTVACPAPSSMAAGSVTATSANLTWTAGGTETAWILEWKAGATFTPGTGAEDGTASPTTTPAHSLSSLTANTTYYVYYQADCSGAGKGSSTWVGPYTFTTPCVAFSTPYSEGFESGYTYNVDIGGCISQESVTGSNTWTANDGTTTSNNRTPKTGAWHAFLRYGNEDWLFIPITLTGGTNYTAEVYAKQDGSTTSNSNVGISYGTTNTAAGMTNTIVTPVGIDATYQLIQGTFTPSSTGTYYIGVKGYMNNSPWYISIDDIAVYETPSCLSPSTLTATNITATSVDLGWTENNSATSWQVEYGADGFTPGMGTGTAVVTASNPYSASSLSDNTTYDFYVRAICGPGDTSAWSVEGAFTTLCAAATTINENFDATSTTQVPDCWTELIDGGASSSAYADVRASNPNSGANSLAMYNSGSNSGNVIIVSPLLSNLSAGTHRLRFFAKNSTASQDIEVGTITDPTDGSTFTSLQTVDINTTYTEYVVDFSGYAGANTYIAIRRVLSSTYTYVYLDDVVWEEIPTGAPNCSQITSPADAATGVAIDATLSWNANIDATGYKIQIGTTDGGSEFLASTDAGNVTSYAVTGLAYSTTYYVLLTAYNANGDATGCTSTSFTTMADPTVTPPYNESFEGTFLPAGWAMDKTSGNDWTQNTTSSNATDGTKSAKYSWNSFQAADSWLFTTPVALEAGKTYIWSFDQKVASAAWSENLKFTVGTAQTIVGQTTILYDGNGLTNTSFEERTGNFTAPSTGTYYFAFQAYSAVNQHTIYVDNLNIEEACPAITVTSVVGHNAGTVSADMECTDSEGWTHYWNDASNQLVLSIKKNGNNIGTIGDGTFAVSTTDNGSATFYADGTGFITNGLGGVLMNRKWDVTPTTAPSSNVDVRFYYTAQNYTDVNTEITNQGGTALSAHTELNFFKVTSGEDPFVVADLSSSDIELILNGGSVGINTWTAGTFGSDFYAEYQVAGFSGGGGGGASGGAALPVELTSFTAQAEGNTNVLNWETATEENNSHFEVERSTNGVEFEKIGQVEGNGTTVEESNYNFVDETPTIVSYYRLRQVDFDGNFAYSNVVVVKREIGNNNVVMFPVPVQDRLTVQYSATANEEMTITVIDATGRIVVTKAVTAIQGENQFNLNLNELPSGSYFVRLQSDNSNIIRTIIKQ